MTRNITFSAEEKIIEEARIRSQEEHTSLNVVFRDWLYRYAHVIKSGRNIPRSWSGSITRKPEGNSAGMR